MGEVRPMEEGLSAFSMLCFYFIIINSMDNRGFYASALNYYGIDL